MQMHRDVLNHVHVFDFYTWEIDVKFFNNLYFVTQFDSISFDRRFI